MKARRWERRLFDQGAKCLGALLLVNMLSLAMVHPASAVCEIGLELKGSISDANIDGLIDISSELGDWSDARVMQSGSGSGCLNFLLDGPPPTPGINQNVSVYSKRDASNLYFAFAVPDSTKTLGSVGERIVIQIDPNKTAGPELSGDFKIEIEHKWVAAGGGSLAVASKKLWQTGGAGVCGAHDWQENTTAVTSIKVGLAQLPGNVGYAAEIKIPLSVIGNPANSSGIAFAVVNALDNCPVGTCSATGIAFPNSVPINNMNSPLSGDPLDPTGCQVSASWVVPSAWGTGFFSEPAGDVYLVNTPTYWLAPDVAAFRCSEANALYEYNQAHPCRIRVRADLRTTSGANQTVNVVYAWARFGAGQNEWKVLDIREGITVPVGAGQGATSPVHADSIEWDGVPKNLTDHPCVRVFILPSTYLPSFDKAKILSMTTSTEIDQMVAAYALGGNQHGQRNISLNAMVPDCPLALCRIAGLFQLNASAVFVSDAYATHFVGHTVDGPHTSDGREDGILLTPVERRRYQDGNVIVQVRECGYTKSRGKSQYNFIECLGGATKLYPVGLVREALKSKNAGLPMELVIGNPGKDDRIITLLTQAAASPPLTPAELQDFKVAFPTGPEVFKGRQEITVKGAVGHKDSVHDSPDIKVNWCFEWLRKTTGITLAAGLLAIGIVLSVRSRLRGKG
jgi:hypothetical protein